MKSLRLLLPFLLLVGLMSVVFFVRADCINGDIGTVGNDTINCTVANPPAANVQAGDGDDTIIIDAGVVTAFDISGGNTLGADESGNDTIINNGQVDAILGDTLPSNGSGNDTIINNNIATGTIYGDTINGDGTGNDIITNNGSAGGDIIGDTVFGTGAGSDSITNNGNLSSSVWADTRDGIGSGNDTVINNGVIGGSIYGDSVIGDGIGNDTIVNGGTVGGIVGDTELGVTATGNDVIINTGTTNAIFGDDVAGTGTGADTITNSGTVNGGIVAGGGEDIVVIGANTAQVGGTIDGGAGYDLLTFTLSSTNPDQLRSWADQIYAANPAGGTLTFNGHTYTWTNFEELTQLLFSFAPINNIGDPLAVFCAATGGVDVYFINGDDGSLSIQFDAQEISNNIAVAVETDLTIEIGNSATSTVYVTPDSEIQVTTPNGFSFSFIYQDFCGLLPEAGAIVVEVEEEELPAFTIVNQPYGG